MVPTLWLGLLALAPLAVVGMVTARPGRAWSTRVVPADGLRAGIGVGVAAWVHPALGLLALLGAVHWLWNGWERAFGGLIYLWVALGLWLGLQAPLSTWQAATATALALGVVEVLLATSQALGLPWFRSVGRSVHGTLGHRTTLGAYLALLVPLAFLATPGVAWGLVGVYAIGLLLSASAVAGLAVVIGLLIVHGTSGLPVALGLGLAVYAVRTLSTCPWWKLRASPSLVWARLTYPRFVLKTARARWRCWTYTAGRMRRWPLWQWSVGAGPGAFSLDARRWPDAVVTGDHAGELFREAHNDWLEFVYEHGLLGLVALGLALATLVPRLAARDPLTAALAALALLMAGTFPLRIAPLLGVAALVVVGVLR